MKQVTLSEEEEKQAFVKQAAAYFYAQAVREAVQ